MWILVEMLQQMIHPKPQWSSGLNMCAQEACGCGGGQGSPLLGDTASSPLSRQHSPSLPISGLTEFSDTDSTPWDRSSTELQELLAAKDPARSTGAPQKQYVGVRVKMPVRELLKKLRLSRGVDAQEGKETSIRMATRKNSGATGKRRACSKTQYKQSRQQTPAALKSVEDLDILVEVLQEDLHQSHAKQETRLWEMGHCDGLPEVWPPFEEAESNLQPESSWELARWQPLCSFQLCHEESWLRKIPLEKLLVPDENGDSLLHKAVRQGERALAFALAWRFAYHRKIDQRDGTQKTALHITAQKNHHLIFWDLVSLGASINERDGAQKTPLHLCAQNGYVRVLEVLRHCWHSGIHVELGAVDNQGQTALQCAVLAHSNLLLDLTKPGLLPEMRKALTLRKEQIFAGICCLMQMGAGLQDQGSVSLTGLDETALLHLQGGDQRFPPAAWSSFSS